MGYCMNQHYSKFFIPASKVAKALKAIQQLHGKETIEDSSGKHFAWIVEDFYKRKTLPAIMDDWRWHIELDARHNVVNIQFRGEKIGSDHILFQAIAPFVQAGSYIHMIGEDADQWKWVFDGEHVSERQGIVVFPE